MTTKKPKKTDEPTDQEPDSSEEADEEQEEGSEEESEEDGDDEAPSEEIVVTKHEDELVEDKRVAQFDVNRDDFTTFVEAAQCKGILHVDNEKVKEGMLFSNFLLQVSKDGIIIKGTDTKQSKVIAQHIFKAFNEKTTPKGAVVVSEGEIPITNVKDLLTAMKLCTGGKDDTITIVYPDKENRVFVGKKGTDTGWTFPSNGKREVTSLEKVNSINHTWDAEKAQVVSKSAQTGQVLRWKNKIITLPEEVKRVASDMKDFVKQKVVNLKIEGNNVVFSLGAANSTRKGKRQLIDVSRQLFKDTQGWMQADKNDKLDEITANYFHGFYAVLQNIPDKNALEMHFQKIGPMDLCWIRSFNSFMELHYLIPYEQTT